MTDPRQIAMSILDTIDWQTEVSGFCRCPGEGFHTSANGKRDCRVKMIWFLRARLYLTRRG